MGSPDQLDPLHSFKCASHTHTHTEQKKKTLNLQRQVLNLLPKGLISSGSVMVSKAAGLLIVKSKFVYKISKKKKLNYYFKKL